MLHGQPTPLIVDHDMTKRVGTVEGFFEHMDLDGPWLVARCTVDAPPPWLRRGTPASFGYIALRDQTIGSWQRILQGLVKEVSVLSTAKQPAEACAAVELYRETPEQAARSTGEEFSLPRGVVLRRPGGSVLGLR